jgi:hemerythrin-like domain-containing protein
MTTGIDLIRLDHRRVEACFEEFARTRDATLVGQIFDMLTAHDDAEQGALYPLMEAVGVPAAKVADARQAHSVVQVLMDHARQQEGIALLADIAALQQAVQRHVQAEEQTLLPALEQRATLEQLDGLAARILQVKQRVG